MNLENLLDGKWKFVGAEKFNGSEWVATDSYISSMTWEFQTHLIGIKKRIGVIIEQRPQKADHRLNYAYDYEALSLKVDTAVDCIEIDTDDLQADIYEVIILDQPLNQIQISILNENGCPPPYFRYTLHKIEEV